LSLTCYLSVTLRSKASPLIPARTQATCPLRLTSSPTKKLPKKLINGSSASKVSCIRGEYPRLDTRSRLRVRARILRAGCLYLRFYARSRTFAALILRAVARYIRGSFPSSVSSRGGLAAKLVGKHRWNEKTRNRLNSERMSRARIIIAGSINAISSKREEYSSRTHDAVSRSVTDVTISQPVRS